MDTDRFWANNLWMPAVVISLSIFIEGVYSDGGCDPYWQPFDGDCYVFSENFMDVTKGTWSSAQSACLDLSAHLVTIADKPSWDWIKQQMGELQLSDQLWIGLRRSGKEFSWEDGAVANTSLFFWTDPRRNEFLNSTDTCIYASRAGWSEDECSSQYHFICYRESGYGRISDVALVWLSIAGSLVVLAGLVVAACRLVPNPDVISHEDLNKNVKRTKRMEDQEREHKVADAAAVNEGYLEDESSSTKNGR